MATSESKTIGPYEIRGTLGRGGMATVYRAYQPSLDREVAVKVMSNQFADDPNFMERFRREARSIAKLDHPNILAVYDFGQDGNIPYIVTQLLEGKTLRERLGQPLDPRFAAKITTQIGAALSYAHERGMVHRDVKPSNVLMDKRDRAVLSDFGIVKLLESDSNLTATGLGVGTPDYMSPEQGMGEALDGRSDLYALGVMLYEMLTGVTPFRADTPLAVMMGHVNRPLPDPLQYNPRLTPDMVAVLYKALAKHRDDRYVTVEDFADAFNEAVYSAGLPPLPSSSSQAGRSTGPFRQGTGTQPAVGAAPEFGALESTRVSSDNPPPAQLGTGSDPSIPFQQPTNISNPAMPPITGSSNPAFPVPPVPQGFNLPPQPVTNIFSQAAPPVVRGTDPNISGLPTEFLPGQNLAQTRPITGAQPPLTNAGEQVKPNNFIAQPGEATVYSTSKLSPPAGPLSEPGAPTVQAGQDEVAKIAEARRAARAAETSAASGQANRFAGPSGPNSNQGEATRATGFVPGAGEQTVYATGQKTPPPGPPPTGSMRFNQPPPGPYGTVRANPPTPPPPAGFGYETYNPQGNNHPVSMTGTGAPGGVISPAMPVSAEKEPGKRRGVTFILIGVIVAALVVIAVVTILLVGVNPSAPSVTPTVNAAVLPIATVATTPSVPASIPASAISAAATTGVTTPLATNVALATTAAPSATATAAPTSTAAPTATSVPTATSASTATLLPALAVLNVGTSRRGDTDIAQPEDVTDQFTAGQEVFGFIHADNANPNVDKVDVTVIKDGTTQPVKSVTLTKASGFNFFSLGKIDTGSYKIEVRFKGNLVGKQPEFKVVAAPTAVPTQAPVVRTTAPVVVKTTAPVVVKTTAPVVKTTAPVVRQPTPTPCPPGSC